MIKDFLKITNPTKVLELGTGMGAISLLIKDVLPSVKLLTIDRKPYPEHEILFMNGIVPLYADIHDADKIMFGEVANLFIQHPGTTLVLCDNGRKIDEFIYLSQFLKIGDYIMAHDYSVNRETRVWDFNPEICDADIREACEMYNLKDFYNDFKGMAWVCKVKL